MGVDHPREPLTGWAVDLEALEVGVLECRADPIAQQREVVFQGLWEWKGVAPRGNCTGLGS
jgi:hypothetical protein